jgi:hypothetical protein
MPPKGKLKARAFKPSFTQTKIHSTTSPELSTPFKRAPKALEPFLSKLEKSHIYITHVDSKPRDFKQKIFLVPLAMNITIIGLILWRIKSIGPFYMKICFSLMGKDNELTIDTARTPFEELLWEILRRTGIFVLDLLIYVFIWPWPRDFFAGRTIGNPISWRLGVGFRDKEIIVRRSRKWDRMIGNPMEEGEGQSQLFEIVGRATDPIWMSEKTGYLMLTKEWDLDWRLMVIATKLVDKKKLALEDFRTTVLVYNEEWTIIETGTAGGSSKEEEGRRKIVAFKDELTALGKENLFFRWIELVQFESSQPGGFGPEQQQKTMAKAKAMFEAQGIDFDQFWAKVGGMEGMPGMDQM